MRRTNQLEDENIESGGICMDVGAHHVTVDGKEH